VNKKWKEMYKQKLRSVEECAELIQDGDGIGSALGNGATAAIMDAAADRVRAGKLRDIVYISGIDLKPTRIMAPDLQDRIRIVTGFTGPAVRTGVQKGYYSIVSNRLGQVEEIVVNRIPGIKNSIVMAQVSAMDENGFFSSGTNAEVATGFWRRSGGLYRDLILEVNENMPRTFGNSFFHISEVTALCEVNNPLVEIPDIPSSKEDEIIGQYIADRVPDGACIQVGIGGVPNAVTKLLHDKKDLGVHSEMLTDAMVDLYYDGVITCSKKTFHKDKIVSSFAMGTKKLYDFINNNPFVEMYPASYVNDPYNIGLNDNVISVNATLEVDLTGQCASESIGPIQYSGAGGQLDFVQGCWRSKGGQSFIAIHSTYTDKNGNKHSSIKPMLTPGAIVNTPRSDVDNIVTEYGIAHLQGDELKNRAKSLIAVAHPDFRDELTFYAKKMNWLK